MIDRLGDLIESYVDTTALWTLIEKGAPKGLPTVRAGQR
jgi:hypothetical protein